MFLVVVIARYPPHVVSRIPMYIPVHYVMILAWSIPRIVPSPACLTYRSDVGRVMTRLVRGLGYCIHLKYTPEKKEWGGGGAHEIA